LPAYRSKTDKWDRHYHEFEDYRLAFRKTGWKIITREKFTHPVKKIGFRPLFTSLRDIIWFTLKKLRTKIVYCF
jgi:hypothetical protein